MALTERCENDKIEIIGPYKSVQVRCATIIERDGKEVARQYDRYVLQPGILDENDNLIDTDISKEETTIQAVCNSVWTSEIKEAWRQHLIENKLPSNSTQNSNVGIGSTYGSP